MTRTEPCGCGGSSLTEVSGYLRRHNARVASGALRRHIVFGLVIGGLLLVKGAFEVLFVAGSWDQLWTVVACLGAFSLVLTVVFPSAWAWPERWFRRLTSVVGRGVFSALLSVVYVVLFWPVGWWMRMRHGTDPIYAWEGEAPRTMQGWTAKTSATIAHAPGARGERHLILQPFVILGFFFQRGNLLLVPALVLLLVLGLLLFFVQTSALAPFIYTLF
jgi:hypothetical protein